jgi:hypothetical protein
MGSCLHFNSKQLLLTLEHEVDFMSRGSRPVNHSRTGHLHIAEVLSCFQTRTGSAVINSSPESHPGSTFPK